MSILTTCRSSNEYPLRSRARTQLTYLAQCPGSTCTGVNSATLKWFKIDEAGLLSGTIGDGYWAAGKMIDQNSTWTTTIPASVPSGNYLIRFETIALHSLPAQLYPECAQLEITGGGNRAPTADELVSFPGGYSASDPGCESFCIHSPVDICTGIGAHPLPSPRITVNVDLYTNEAKSETTYIIPGPPLYGAGTGSPAPAPSVCLPPLSLIDGEKPS